MSGTMGMLQRLSALRQRLAEVGSHAPQLEQASPHQQLLLLEHQLAQLRAAQRHLEPVGNAATEGASSSVSDTAAYRFDWRVRRLLLHGRRILDRLRGLIATFTTGDWADGTPGLLFQETLEITRFALRAAEHWPSEGQEPLANGLEALLGEVERWLGTLEALDARRRRQLDRLYALESLLRTILQGGMVSLASLRPIALELIEEEKEGQPLAWFTPNPSRPIQWAAACGLNTASVLARLLPSSAAWSGRPVEAVTAALLCDAGMAQVPPDLLELGSRLAPEQRGLVESHVETGCAVLRAALPAEEWLLEAVNQHHERPNGTGYPAGVAAPRLNSLGKLLAVASTYAALCTARPWRPALSPLAALAEVLVQAETEGLDKEAAARLEREVGPYPMGTLVELSDGHLARVVGPSAGLAIRGGRLADRPIVQLLGQPTALPSPFRDLMLDSRWQIVRGFSRDEARKLAGREVLELW